LSDETMGPLDLSGADLTGFDPVPSGPYKVEVFEFTPTKIDKEDGKLPEGTPGYAVQLKIVGDTEGNEGEDYEFNNRRVFTRFYFPGEGYDKSKASRMKGIFVKFLVALGYDETEVMSGAFTVDPDDVVDRECVATLGYQPEQGGYPAQNKVNAWKSLQEVAASSTGLL
jgi:hypothetical protein